MIVEDTTCPGSGVEIESVGRGGVVDELVEVDEEETDEVDDVDRVWLVVVEGAGPSRLVIESITLVGRPLLCVVDVLEVDDGGGVFWVVVVRVLELGSGICRRTGGLAIASRQGGGKKKRTGVRRGT